MTVVAPPRPAPKPGLLDIPPYVPGKSKLADGVKPLKLSSNENALGASPAAREAYLIHADGLFRYPDGHASALRQAVSAHFGLEPERLMFGAGSDEVFALLNQTYLEPGDNMVTTWHGFLAYRISAAACQAEVRRAPEPNLKIDVEAVADLVDARTKLVFLSNPANPAGTFIPLEEIDRLCARVPANVLIVIDEAYAEFAEGLGFQSALERAKTSDRLIVTRTFSKIHGLAALRLGWGYAPAPVAEAVERIRLPFNTTTAAQAAGIAALSDTGHVAASRALVQEGVQRLTQSVAGLGFHVTPSVANFILIHFESVETAQAVDAHLQSHGIIVRHVAAYDLPQCLRVTIGTADENARFLSALEAWVK